MGKRTTIYMMTVTLLAACGGDRKATPAGRDAGAGVRNADDGVAARRALAAHAADVAESTRAALAAPDADPGATPGADVAYADARAAATAAAAAAPDVTADQVLALVDRWVTAPDAVRALGRDPRAAKAAQQVAIGAARPDGATPLADGEDLAPWRVTVAVVIAHALEEAAAGRAEVAAWRLAALVRMTQDLARRASAREAVAAAGLGRAALAAWRAAVAGATPDQLATPKLAAQLAACEVVMASAPRYVDVARAERRRLAVEVMVIDGATPRPPTMPAEAEAAARAWVKERGGIAGVVASLDALGKSVDAIRAAADGPTEALALVVGEQAAAGGRAAEIFVKDHVGALALWQADAAATCVAHALVHHRRGAKKLPAALDALAPGSLAKLPQDPITGAPFEYVVDQLGNALVRSGPVAQGGQPVRVELSIAAR